MSTVTLEGGRQGAHSVRVGCTAYPSADQVIPTSHADLFQKGIGLGKGQHYRLSFWSKGQAGNSQAARVRLVDTSDWGYHAVTRPLALTADWAHTEIDFRSSQDVRASAGMLWFTLDAVGDLWLDEVTLVPRRASEPPRYQPRVAACGTRNLLPNSSFEAGTDGWATLGKTTGWGGDVSGLIGQIDASEAYEGKQSLRLDLGPGKTQVTYYDCWPACRQVQDAPQTANLGWIEVPKGRPLTLSAWLRSERSGVPAKLVFTFGGDPTRETPTRTASRGVTLSDHWERYSFTTEAAEADVFVAVGPDLTDGVPPTATVWIDALQLEEGATASEYERRLPVEIGVLTGESAGFTAVSGTPRLQVSAAQVGDTPVTIGLTLELEDYFGTPLPAQTLEVRLPARGRLDHDWPLRLPGTGFYRGRVGWEVSGRSLSRPVRFVTCAPYAAANSPFGINHAPISVELVRAIQRAGVTWARDWSVLWGHLEAEPGKLSYASADAQIQRLLDLGMQVVCLVPPLPSTDWNSMAPAAVPPTRWQRMAYLPSDEEALLAFMTTSAARYRGRVDVLEFLNEPVWTEFCLPGTAHHKPGASYTPADYLRLLKKAYPALKAGNPECTVIGGFSAEPWRFTKEFIEARGLDYVDVLNIHNYGGLKPPESYIPEMKALLGWMDGVGKRRPIWITEYAYYGLDEFPWSPWEPLAGAWSHNLLLRDERQGADWSIRYALIMLAHGTERIFYHQGAEGVVNNGSANVECPLLGEQGKPLKLYAAQAILAGLLGPKPIYAGELATPAAVAGQVNVGVYGYAFQCGDTAVLAVWCVEGQAATDTWALRAPADAAVYNLMGNRLAGGRVGLDISPVYVTSTAHSASALARVCRLQRPAEREAPEQP